LFANVFIMLRPCFLTNCNAMRDNFQYKISSQEMAKVSLAREPQLAASAQVTPSAF
jgi:hypothetical protein